MQEKSSDITAFESCTFVSLLVEPVDSVTEGKGALTWPKLLTLFNDSFTSFFRC